LENKGRPMAKRPINVEIKPKHNEHPDRLIRRFTRKVKKEGILDEVRERRYYEKPSTRKRKEKIRRKRLAKREQEKNSK